MWAPRVDALAPPVDQVGCGRLAGGGSGEQAWQPGREVPASHVAVPGRPDPARRQAQANQVGGAQLGGVGQVLEVQQAEIVLASLAHHGPAGSLGRVGKQDRALALDLPLEGPGVGRDPDRGAVDLSPGRCGRQVAQGLAHARAGLGQKHAGAAFPLPRLEDEGGFPGVLRLGCPVLFQAGPPQEDAQPADGRLGADRGVAGLACGARILPLCQAGPDIEAGTAEGVAGRMAAQGLRRRRPPGPATPGEGLCKGQGLLPGGRRALGQFLKQANGDLGQGLRHLEGPGGFGASKGEGQACRRRGREGTRTHEGEQLEYVEHPGRPGRRVQSQPAGGQGRVRHQDFR